MGRGPPHRDGGGDLAIFASAFVNGRLAGFEKDVAICLAPSPNPHGSGTTHAYFPAFAACCGLLEYMTGLHRGNLRGMGWRQLASWAELFLPQPEYGRDTVRILYEAFRHPVAHRGIASGVWVDQAPGAGQGRRITWKLHADARHPVVDVVAEAGQLHRDPPWPCPYTHRVHIHLRRLAIDLAKGARAYAAEVGAQDELRTNFERCMRQLYPVQLRGG